MSTKATIGVVSMGSMGSGISRRLVERGAHVLTALSGRSEASHQRARQAGVNIVTEAELVNEAELILSVVPPAASLATAQNMIPHLASRHSDITYADLNAVAPATVTCIETLFDGYPVNFIDGGIIGGPPRAGAKGARIYLSGKVGKVASTLADPGLDARDMQKASGQASALKLSYAMLTKGLMALGSMAAIRADQTDVIGELVDELGFSQPDMLTWFGKALKGMPPKAYRWDGEMLEIAKFLAEIDGGETMYRSISDFYRSIAEAHNNDTPDDSITSIVNFSSQGQT